MQDGNAQVFKLKVPDYSDEAEDEDEECFEEWAYDLKEIMNF